VLCFQQLKAGFWWLVSSGVGKSHDSTYDTHVSVICAFEIHGVCLGQGGSPDFALSCGEDTNLRMVIDLTESLKEKLIDDQS
jgi:hypothetical protein